MVIQWNETCFFHKFSYEIQLLSKLYDDTECWHLHTVEWRVVSYHDYMGGMWKGANCIGLWSLMKVLVRRQKKSTWQLSRNWKRAQPVWNWGMLQIYLFLLRFSYQLVKIICSLFNINKRQWYEILYNLVYRHYNTNRKFWTHAVCCFEDNEHQAFSHNDVQMCVWYIHIYFD